MKKLICLCLTATALALAVGCQNSSNNNPYAYGGYGAAACGANYGGLSYNPYQIINGACTDTRTTRPVNPTLCSPAANAFGTFGANPYGVSPYGANPYGATPYGANPYGATPYANAYSNPACSIYGGGVGGVPPVAGAYGAANPMVTGLCNPGDIPIFYNGTTMCMQMAYYQTTFVNAGYNPMMYNYAGAQYAMACQPGTSSCNCNPLAPRIGLFAGPLALGLCF